jgi:hypothetical protein
LACASPCERFERPRYETLFHIPIRGGGAAARNRIGDTIVVEMNNGAALVIPRRLMQGLTNATPEQLQQAQLCGDGTFIDFDELDAQFTVMSLLMGIYGGKRWMSELAGRAGATRSPAKSAAARTNGRKGGRPQKKAA